MAKIIKLVDICRTCAKTSKNEELIPLFPNGAIKDIKQYQNTKFQVSKDDGLPQQICGECLDQFNDMNEFIEKCVQKQLLLEKKFNIVIKTVEIQNSNVTTNNEYETNQSNNVKIENMNNDENNIKTEENYANIDENFIIEELLDEQGYENTAANFKFEEINDDNAMEIENKNEESNTNLYEEVYDDDDLNDNDNNIDSKIEVDDDFDVAKELEKAIKLAHQNKSVKLDKLKYENNSDDDNGDEDYENIYETTNLNNDCSKDFSCELCPEKNMSFYQLQNHIKYLHKKKTEKYKSVMCDMCGEVVKEVRLEVHMNDHLGIPNETKDCEICGRTGFTKDQYRGHVYKHVKPNHFCEHCNKGFRSLRNLQIHNQMNPDKKCVEKKIPNKSIDSKATLQCLYCMKKFITAVSLVKHCRTHSKPDIKDAKHVCNYCGTAFKRADHLKIHINSQHLKTEEFKCKICDKICYASFRLNRHMKTKHFNKQIRATCEYCKKSFSNPQCLRRHHLQTHNKPKCPICGEEFNKNTDLKHHSEVHNSLITNEVQKEIILKEFCPNVLDNSGKRKIQKSRNTAEQIETSEEIEIEEVDEMDNYVIYEDEEV